MAARTTYNKSNYKQAYGLFWPITVHPAQIEIDMIRHGGRWKKKDGTFAGNGLVFHYRRLQELLWPREKLWHRWNLLELECYVNYRTICELGPASCVSGDTRILDPITGNSPTIEELYTTGSTPRVMTLNGPAIAGVPFIKGVSDLYEVILENGSRFKATANHLVLSKGIGFCRVSDLRCGSLLLAYDPSLPLTTSGLFQSVHASGEGSFLETVQGSQYGCPDGRRSCGEPLLWGADTFQEISPSQFDAPERMANAFSCEGDWESKSKHSPIYQSSFHPSILGVADRAWHKETFGPCQSSEGMLGHASDWCGSSRQFLSESSPVLTCEQSDPRFSDTLPRLRHNPWWTCESNKVHPVAVSSIKYCGRDFFFDLQVPDHHHYFAEGAIHHNSGKTNSAATNALTDFYCYPECTTVLICSTTRERLEDRVWGEIKKYHRLAKERINWLPGNLIEGRQRLVTDNRSVAIEGRDFRNGVIGVACKKGSDYVGLGDFIGIKNKRVRLVGDELHLLPRVFVDAISNLDKNPDLKVVGLGNPKETTDALGILAEPAASLGGWDSGLDQVPKTKTWETRRPGGICIQLCGADSPNLDGKMSIPLITQAAIDRDIAFYGKDSLQFTMMNMGMMPRGQGSRRVITRQMCVRNRALEQPIWRDTNLTKIGFLDAAYRGVGGDRCVFGYIEFGEEARADESEPVIEAIISQRTDVPPRRQLLHLAELTIVPVKVSGTIGAPVNEVEDQITEFCMQACTLRGIPPANFFYDSGMRTSLVTSMTRLWSIETNPIDCGGSPSERKVSEGIDVICKDYYSKKITEFWYSVRLIIEAQQFRGMTEDVMLEGCSREWRTVGNNKIEVETKDEMKEKTGRSPDLFDALAIGVEGARQRGFSIGSLVKKETRSRGQLNWRTDLRVKARELIKSKELNYSA